MKRGVAIICLFLVYVCALSAASKSLASGAVEPVEKVFCCLKKVSEERKYPKELSVEFKNYEMCFWHAISTDGKVIKCVVNAPKDLEGLGYKGSIARVMSYLRNFGEFFDANRDYSFQFQIMNEKNILQPEFGKKKNDKHLSQVTVRKVYLRNGVIVKSYNDILEVKKIDSMNCWQIERWRNENEVDDDSHRPNPNSQKPDIRKNDITTYKLDAAIAYNAKKYDKAYAIYKMITNDFPDEAEPYYRMAVMLYENKKDFCYRVEGTNNRDKLILEYLDTAMDKPTRHNNSIFSKSWNMRQWITR